MDFNSVEAADLGTFGCLTVEVYKRQVLQYTGNILLVGINYDKKTKVHECIIEELVK